MLKTVKILPQNRDCIRLIQLTDTHIFASPASSFDGMDTEASLARVLIEAGQQPAVDLVLVTGDLVHDPHGDAYRRLWRQLSRLASPVYCLPGNHDDPELMHKLLHRGNVRTDKLLELGKWRIVLLDTFVCGSHGGKLASSECDFLEQALAQGRDAFVLIGLHHHPVPIASSWMDGMMLRNPEVLFNIIDSHENVRGIIWGHIHQEFRSQRQGLELFGSPSTCIQFKPGSDTFARDELGPGYSIIELSAKGEIAIEVRRLADFP